MAREGLTFNRGSTNPRKAVFIFWASCDDKQHRRVHTVPLKFKIAVFLFCFNPSSSNKGFALCRSIERQ